MFPSAARLAEVLSTQGGIAKFCTGAAKGWKHSPVLPSYGILNAQTSFGGVLLNLLDLRRLSHEASWCEEPLHASISRRRHTTVIEDAAERNDKSTSSIGTLPYANKDEVPHGVR